MSAEIRCPWEVSSVARCRVDFVVHRSGDMGSPRMSGSTRASNAGRSPEFRSATRLRPPPGRRIRPSGAWPESNSVTPVETVASRTPAARATSLIPTWPSARASAPISNRRCRSSRCGNIAVNLAANQAWVSSGTCIPQASQLTLKTTSYSSASPNCVRHLQGTDDDPTEFAENALAHRLVAEGSVRDAAQCLGQVGCVLVGVAQPVMRCLLVEP